MDGLQFVFTSVFLLTKISPAKIFNHISLAGISNCIPHYSVGCNFLSLPEISSDTKVLIYPQVVDGAFKVFEICWSTVAQCYDHFGHWSYSVFLWKYSLVGMTEGRFRYSFMHLFHFQFRVESMMLRIAKPMNYIPVSPSVQQRASMKAPECIPLTMEPDSRMYTHPVVVLDFQSLYPSIMIAHNYCYSTCLGRTELLSKAK